MAKTRCPMIVGTIGRGVSSSISKENAFDNTPGKVIGERYRNQLEPLTAVSRAGIDPL
jgi:hypothetical protein